MEQNDRQGNGCRLLMEQFSYKVCRFIQKPVRVAALLLKPCSSKKLHGFFTDLNCYKTTNNTKTARLYACMH